MRVLILGASGRTGKLATFEALQRGYTVTALVRNPSTLRPKDGLTTVKGTPPEQIDIETAFAATPADPVRAVLVLLNNARASDSPFSQPVSPPYLVRDSVCNIMAVMRKHSVYRLLVISSFGVSSSWTQLPWLMKLVFQYTNMRIQLEDHNATDAEVTAADWLDWTLVRLTMLKEGDLAPAREFGKAGKGVGLFSGITRASVASFVVEAIESQGRSKQAVVIAN